MRVPVYERQQSINPLRGGEVNAVTPAGDYGAQAAGLAKGLALKIQQLQNDNEDARTLEAFNKFKNDSMNYHEDPDKGIYNTRLGGNSEGVFNEADTWLREKGESYVNKLKSERSKTKFRNMARDYIMQKGQQNSRFEAAQMRKYQAEQAQATYKNGLSEITANPYDENFVESTKQNMLDALELEYRYSSPEVRKQALSVLEDDIAAARFSTMFNDDPEKADKWFRDNEDKFSTENKAKFTKSLESFRVQSAVDALVQDFPLNKQYEGLDFIRKNFKGGLEDRIASAYKARINEKASIEYYAQQELRRNQSALKDSILREYYLNGNMPGSETLRNYVENQQLSYQDAASIESVFNTGTKRNILTQRLQAQNPNLSMEELETAVMRKMGTTEQERRDVYVQALDQILSGNAEPSILDYYYKTGKLTTKDVNEAKRRIKGIDKHLSDFYTSELSYLNKQLNALKKDFGLTETESNEARNYFVTQAVMNLSDKYSKTYKTDLQNLTTKALLDAIEQSGLRKSGAEDIYTEISERVYQPDLEFIIPDPEEIGLDADNNTNINTTSGTFNYSDMVSGGRVTGKFSDWRAYRNGQHNGIDVAAPEGTDIKSANFGVPLTVSLVKTGSKTAGNYVILEGEYDTGDKIKVQINHMKDNSIAVKKDDIVNAGDIIGQVGSTGHSSGAHMDLKIKINGKPVDPETWQPPSASSQVQSKTQQAQKDKADTLLSDLNALFGLSKFFQD